MQRDKSDERSGLLLIGCSLLVIALTMGLLLRSQVELRRDRSRAQGASLARLLSSMPAEGLLPGPAGQGALRVVRSSQSDPHFAYVAAVGLRGEPLAQEVMPGVAVPSAPVAGAPDTWMGERLLSGAGPAIREFHAPLLLDGERVGELRVGFREPGWMLLTESLSLFGAMALPIFLLAPLAYLLIRREVRHLSTAAGRLDLAMTGKQLQPVDAMTAGAGAGFVDAFNRFVALVDQRMRDLESEKTDIRASTRVLGYQKSRFESVIETLPDATVLLDEKGIVTFANARLGQVLGVSPEDALGRTPGEWCPVPEVFELLTPGRGGRGLARRSEMAEFTIGEAGEVHIAASAHPLHAPGAEDEFGGTVVIFRDVTASTVARAAQGEFVTQVAHELKSPLNVIGMYSEALLGEDGASESFRIEACNTLRDEVERVSLLVSTLLTISRIESGSVLVQRQRIRLQEFLRDVLETASRGGRASGQSFRLDLPADVPTIFADKELLRVALNNLLTNAVKYNREGGEVTLSIDDTDDRLSLIVRDTGVGISKEDRARVFEKFFRSDAAEVQQRGGHGLGLALVAEIATLHGAVAAVESTPGEGSVFSITFRNSAVLADEEGAA